MYNKVSKKIKRRLVLPKKAFKKRTLFINKYVSVSIKKFVWKHIFEVLYYMIVKLGW